MRLDGGRDRQVQLVIETFDEKARTYAKGYLGDSSTAHSFGIRRQRVYELLGGRRGGKLLDVGCGPGVTVADLVSRGFEFYGVDISRGMIDQCLAEFGHSRSAHFAVGKIEQLEFPDGFFDAVLSVGVVEYVDDDDVAVREMARVLKRGGTVVVTLPNRRSPFRFWQRSVYEGLRRAVRAVAGRAPAPAGMAHREYSERAYCGLLASHGLKVTDVVYYNFKVFLFPFDRWFPRMTVTLSRKLERLGRGRLRWLGTGFIVAAEKM